MYRVCVFAGGRPEQIRWGKWGCIWKAGMWHLFGPDGDQPLKSAKTFDEVKSL